jgi:hypothetical protein
VLIHGWEPQVYLIPDHVKQGVNVTIEVLQRALRAYEEGGKHLPDILYLQVDNTCKQNKSRFLMAYLGELIRAGVFREVYVSFLPVGHTHEDIDQMFSRFAMGIRVRDTVTMEEMISVFHDAYQTAEGLRPNVSIVRYVANISEHLDSLTKAWANLGIAQYYQFHIFADPDSPDRRPLVRGRQSTAGDEIFRGLFKHAFHACDDNTAIFDQPEQRIIWEDIQPSQRKPRNVASLAQFKATIMKGNEQWGYSADQFEGLKDMWELLDSEDPLPFHWLSSGLWPCSKGSDEAATAVVGVQAPLTDHVRSSSLQLSSPTRVLRLGDPAQRLDESLANRGPGQVLSEGDVNPFSNHEVVTRNKLFPWRGFSPGMKVLIEPESSSAEAKTDGFWLGELVERPADDRDSDSEGDADDFFVGVHWWGRKKGSSERSWFDEKCKWEPQKSDQGLSIDTISIGTVACEVNMNADGGFRKTDTNLNYLNYYRNHWFKMESKEWAT